MANPRPKRAQINRGALDELLRDCKRCWDRWDSCISPDEQQLSPDVEDVLARLERALADLMAEERRLSGASDAVAGLKASRAALLEEKAKLLRVHPPTQPRMRESEIAAAESVQFLAELVEAAHLPNLQKRMVIQAMSAKRRSSIPSGAHFPCPDD